MFSLDVECVAIGMTHELGSRTPCSVALVDHTCAVLYTALIKPAMPVMSYMTPITGLCAMDLESGISLETSIKQLKAVLPNDAVLVGQKPESDVEWMQLEQGVDYARIVDISLLFRGYNPWFGNHVFHSLQHEARVLLGKLPSGSAHDPVWDAQVSVELYNKAITAAPEELHAMQQMLIGERPLPSIAKLYSFQMDGVCMARFKPQMCICGAPFVG